MFATVPSLLSAIFALISAIFTCVIAMQKDDQFKHHVKITTLWFAITMFFTVNSILHAGFFLVLLWLILESKHYLW